MEKRESMQWENLLIKTYYSGERFVVKRKDGLSIALVPTEDLEMLELMEKFSDDSYPTRTIKIKA